MFEIFVRSTDFTFYPNQNNDNTINYLCSFLYSNPTFFEDHNLVRNINDLFRIRLLVDNEFVDEECHNNIMNFIKTTSSQILDLYKRDYDKKTNITSIEYKTVNEKEEKIEKL